MDKNFTVKDTNIIKGIAVYMLLWHHLFYNSSVDVINGIYSLTGILAYYSKVCVAIFLVLSGYGLTESYKKKRLKAIDFYKKTLKKLYLNYWLIWIIFVPIGVIFFERTFDSVYIKNITIKFIINFLGFQRIFGYEGYNATWWFMSLILGLYILYPLFIGTVRKNLNASILISFLIMFIPNIKIFGTEIIFVYSSWIFPFVLGIFLSEKRTLDNIKNSKNKWKIPLLILLLVFLCIFRLFGKVITEVRIDGFIAVTIISLIYIFLSNIKYISYGLEWIGKHSFDIFLFHTFIYYYYFSSFIYSFKYPLLIFINLLIICCIISYLLEKIKKSIRI